MGEVPQGNKDNMTRQDKFGAEDVFDLTRRQLLNAYTCTECGRCTDECPANKTGKRLSPRKIMMDIRDRMEELISKGDEVKENTLLYNYISPEEIWACTTCAACIEACPIDINPMRIIMDMRQFLVMEKSEMTLAITMMMNAVENNGAPWVYNKEDRLNWANG
ncbi:Fe-S oxidoreductase-like protein [Elysia marginata]|uniref:Fe-S oxidoreductase-like protein n=1 Tax=Elysia marginata TaxID=1093978 RepID=A0AAV4F6S1_9GAST|nr:Fe-S oxidoreductase-like protein [Elysia marginata]